MSDASVMPASPSAVGDLGVRVSETTALNNRFWDAQYERASLRRRHEFGIFLHFLAWARPFWPKLALVVFCGMLGTTISLLPPWLSKYLVDRAFPQRDWMIFWGIFWGYCAMDVFYRLSGTVSSILSNYVNIRVSLNLKVHFFRHLQRLSMTFLHGRPVGEHMFRANADIDAILRMVTTLVPAAIQSLYEFALILVFTTFLDWKVTLLVLLYAIPYTWLAHWVASVRRRLERDARRRWQRYDAGVQEGIAGAMVVKTFSRQRYEVYRYMHLLIDGWRQSMKSHWMWILRDHTVGGILPWLKENLLRIWFFRMVILGELSYGAVFPVLSYMNRLTNPIQQIVDYIQEIRVALIPAERVLETLDVQPAVEDPPDAHPMPALLGEVRFENVAFAYEDGRPVLEGIDFEVEPGQKVAIVGCSGAGKSTIINLLLRLYAPTTGRILVDGQDLARVKINSYQQQIGLVMQDTYLFCGTIRQNLLFGNLNATEEEMVRAAQMAEIHDWIVSQPDGYDTDLSEGTKLSTGQKQRLGLARALVRDPRLLLCDEATSSLDSPTEQRLLATLRKVTQGRTVIWVSHRMNTVVGSDTILVMQNGCIVEQGSHQVLVTQGRHYKWLWDMYFGIALAEEEAAAEGRIVELAAEPEVALAHPVTEKEGQDLW